MNPIDLKTEVSAVIAIRWDAFAAEHPNVARVIDQYLLVEAAVSHLLTDPEYQTAIANAMAVNAGSEFVVKLLDKYVTAWLAKLI